MKRLDVAVEMLVKEVANGHFENRNYSYDLKDGGVGLSPMTYTKDIIPNKLLDEIETLRSEIIAGDRTVSTAY